MVNVHSYKYNKYYYVLDWGYNKSYFPDKIYNVLNTIVLVYYQTISTYI